jgi:NAD(P)-dependent dehydrogenase (short-subunit alcohol dehydrogenase family)
MTNVSRPNASLTQRVALVTGANTGIGRVTALELARQGVHVFVACRSLDRSAGVLEDIRAAGGQGEFLSLDLGDLDSVRRCAAEFLARGLPLHLLINNAGLAGAHGLTKSGFELAFGTNHLGHFLLTHLLLEQLCSSAPARIVTVSSRAHYRVRAIDWEALRRPTQSRTGVPEYSVSKLANALFSAELARRLAGTGVTCYALHPGVVASDVWREVPAPLRWLLTRFMIPTEDGAATTLHCALSPAAGAETGLYYDQSRPRTPSRMARDTALATELWRHSEVWVA